MTTGQLRWAAYAGSWNQTASSSQTCRSSSSASAVSPSGRSRSTAATDVRARAGVQPALGEVASARMPASRSTPLLSVSA